MKGRRQRLAFALDAASHSVPMLNIVPNDSLRND